MFGMMKVLHKFTIYENLKFYLLYVGEGERREREREKEEREYVKERQSRRGKETYLERVGREKDGDREWQEEA